VSEQVTIPPGQQDDVKQLSRSNILRRGSLRSGARRCTRKDVLREITRTENGRGTRASQQVIFEQARDLPEPSSAPYLSLTRIELRLPFAAARTRRPGRLSDPRHLARSIAPVALSVHQFVRIDRHPRLVDLPESVTRDFGVRVFYVMARMTPGVSLAQVLSELDTLRAGVRDMYPNLASAPRLRVTSFMDVLVGSVRRPLRILLACVLLVLTVACVNIASLQLARASARRRAAGGTATPREPVEADSRSQTG
jgi:hypothetical protein